VRHIICEAYFCERMAHTHAHYGRIGWPRCGNNQHERLDDDFTHTGIFDILFYLPLATTQQPCLLYTLYKTWYRLEAIISESPKDEYGYSEINSSPLATNTQTTGVNQVIARRTSGIQDKLRK
jgi:hypothetical protein